MIKKGKTIPKAFQNILKELNRTQTKTWLENGSEFYSRSTKSSLPDNIIEIYLTNNEGKSVVAEQQIRTLGKIIYKYLTTLS